MANLKLQRLDDFTGGLNLRADQFHLDDNESPDLLNVDIDPRGGIKTRPGVVRLNDAAISGLPGGTLSALQLYAWHAATPQLLISCPDRVLVGPAFTDTLSVSSPATNVPHSFAAWSSATDVVYITTIGAVRRWNGSATTTMTSSGPTWQESFAAPGTAFFPQAQHVTTHLGQMWCASTVEESVAYPNRVRWSHPNQPESWRSLDFVDIKDGGTGISAVVSWGDVLLVFKQRSVWAIYGVDGDTMQVVRLTDWEGAVGPAAVASSEAGVFFLSWPDGVFFWNGQGQPKNVSESLLPLFQGGEVNATVKHRFNLAFLNRRLWMSLPLGVETVQSRTWVLDPSIGSEGAWVAYELADGKGFGPGTMFSNASGEAQALAAHPSNPHILIVDRRPASVALDDISTGGEIGFESFYLTKWHDGGVISAKKMWRRPDLIVDAPDSELILMIDVYHNWVEQTVRRSMEVTVPLAGDTLIWNVEGVEPDGIPGWGEANWGAAPAGSLFQRGTNLGSARAVQLRFRAPLGTDWAIKSVTLKYIPRRVRS
jgi:hypothetical protein